jgi:hypothetical protein
MKSLYKKFVCKNNDQQHILSPMVGIDHRGEGKKEKMKLFTYKIKFIKTIYKFLMVKFVMMK